MFSTIHLHIGRNFVDELYQIDAVILHSVIFENPKDDST